MSRPTMPNSPWQTPTAMDLDGPGMLDVPQSYHPNFHNYRGSEEMSAGITDSYEFKSHISSSHLLVRPLPFTLSSANQ